MKLKDIVFKSKKINKAFAWAAHIFTASGLIFGFLGLIAILNGEQTLAFLFMGLALVIAVSRAIRAKTRGYTP